MSKISIIPRPDKIDVKEGVFCLSALSTIQFDEEGALAGKFLQRLTGLSTSICGSIKLLIVPVLGQSPGSYKLVVNSMGIEISSSSQEGLFHGVQTLRQLFPFEAETTEIKDDVLIPFVEISDSPRFSYRGFMLDCARHFFDASVIKTVIDILAFHKINRLHWHLSDDQGWRIEIKKYPGLTEIGSRRKETQIGGSSLYKRRRKFDGKPYEGYYTQKQIKEIVVYARERFIKIIPEIDMPGHMVAALAAYPEYSCAEKTIEVRTSFGISKEVLCVGKDSSITFVKDILDEIIELFPFKHIHIGGDETPVDSWKKCSNCQRLMVQKGFKNEKDLQSYFTNEIALYLLNKGCKVICWDEVLEGSPSKDIIIQYWSPLGKRRVKQEMKKGREFIFSPFYTYYMDYSYNIIPLKKTYLADPALFTKKNDAVISGIESPLWTEWVYNVDRLYWQMLPRLSAVAESAWTKQDNKNFRDFLERLKNIEKRYANMEIPFANRSAYLQKGRFGRLKLFIAIFLSKSIPSLKEYNKYKSYLNVNEENLK
ncbi:MAG: beta-N-acetylhexosaminidase [Spirochaetales bacterium]|nr:beta-N-acetylhexosaminidase [Spirochaetales bacterium]